VSRHARIFIFSLFAPWLAISSAAAQEPSSFDWRGFYLGYHVGGALGLVDVGNPFGASIFGDTVRTPGPLAGGQLGYNWQNGRGLLGLEADASFADLDGTNTCFAYSGYYVSANCRAAIDALGTLTARFGWLPFDGNTLVYGKAGLAWLHGEVDATPNGDIGKPGTDESGVQWGWTVGAGIERAIAPRWTVKAEYGFLAFDDQGFTAPSSRLQFEPPRGELVSVPAARSDISHDIHQFKLGMNYGFGGYSEAGHGGGGKSLSPNTGVPTQGTTFTIGARYVYGWGQFHKDLGLHRRGVAGLASRLTYDNDDISGGEAFARLDTAFNLMAKGLIGGASSEGRLNDEDWVIPFPNALVPYSNTLSGVDNDIDYWLADIGYNLWRGASYKVTPFIGYSEFRQDMTGLGCRQIANPFSDCSRTIPSSVRVITEDDKWQALRLGAAADMIIAPRLTLSGEAAYLPYVRFTGTDDHLLRSLVSPEEGEGVGLQLEATLSYAVTEALSVGVGGRYLSMWTTEGTVNFGGTGEIIAMRYAAEQAHLLVQGSYRFGASR
jgi:opacity protein-like surface antigen/outer membrane protease